MLARWFLFHYILKLWEYAFHSIPFVVRSTRHARMSSKRSLHQTNSFKQVVLVPFPSSENLAIGLLTRDNLPAVGKLNEPLTAVFVPTTPNPTSGFLMLFRETDLIYLDMKVEDALKYVISCGVISSPITTLTKDEAKALLEGATTKPVA